MHQVNLISDLWRRTCSFTVFGVQMVLSSVVAIYLEPCDDAETGIIAVALARFMQDQAVAVWGA
jgi:hypothetical protein